MSFTYAPDSALDVDKEAAIRLLCAPFQSHEAGLPEWIKNSCDAYVREGIAEEQRIIVLFFNRARQGKPASIACLDFVGMTASKIDGDFKRWADPQAADREGTGTDDIQGGHGNGGKCYMVKMFDDYATLYTVRDGRGCRYGVGGGKINFGYVPNQAKGRAYRVTTALDELSNALSTIDASVDHLPPVAMELFAQRQAFSLFVGMGAKGYGRSFPANDLVDSMMGQAQTIRSIEMARIYTVVHRQISNDRKPLSLPEIKSFRGTEPLVVRVPDTLVDPRTSLQIQVSRLGGDDGTLTLRTSDVSMRQSRRARHTITFRSGRRYVGFVPVGELDMTSQYRDRIYGDLDLVCLTEFTQNDRGRLAESPLTRALQEWISDEGQKLAASFEQQDVTARSQADRNAVSAMNEALNEWKNKFIERTIGGASTGYGRGGPGDPPPPPPPLPSRPVTRLDLSVTRPYAGVGVPVRPSLRFLDKRDEHVRPVPYRLVSSDPDVVRVNPELNILESMTPGTASIHAELINSATRSNTADLTVLDINRITLHPTELTVKTGSRAAVHASCETRDGTVAGDVYLVWAENDSTVVGVSPAGSVFGFAPGTTTVTAFDKNTAATEDVVITVAASEGDEESKQFPRILISGVDADPATHEPVVFGPDEAPVMQRPKDVERNIFWINSSAPMADLYLNTRNGYGPESREFRIYMLERYIEVLAQLLLPKRVDNIDRMTISDWTGTVGSLAAEIQALMINDLPDFIANGQLPASA